jgi:hypothetical protein
MTPIQQTAGLPNTTPVTNNLQTLPKVKEKSAKQKCQEGGGFWDEKTQTCLMAPPQKTEAPKTEPNKPAENQVFRDSQTGQPSGVTIGGKTYLGLKPQDVEAMTAAEAAKKGGPSTQAFEQGAIMQAEQAKLQQQGQQLAPLVGQGQTLDAEGRTIDVGAAIGAGAAQAIPGIAAGVVGGATIGALGGPIGAVGGAVIGAVGAFLNGVRSNVAGQLSGDITSKGATVSKVERNLRALVSDTNSNPQNAAQNLEMFNYQLALLEREHAALKRDTSTDLNRFLSRDGTTQLQRFEMFNSQGGSREFLTREMQIALINPNPTKSLVTMGDLMGDDE